MNKKNFFIVAGIAIMLVSLTGCKSQEEKMADDMVKQADKMSDVRDKLMNGEISNEEADKLMDSAHNEAVEDFGRSADGFPSWAKKLGFDEPKNMILKSGEKADIKKEGYNAINLVYVGEYEIAMKEAEKIAKSANLPVSSDYKMMQKTFENMEGIPEEAKEAMRANAPKGIIYSNFSFMSGDDKVQDGGKYYKTIVVEVDGDEVTLEISLVDFAMIHNPDGDADKFNDVQGFGGFGANE